MLQTKLILEEKVDLLRMKSMTISRFSKLGKYIVSWHTVLITIHLNLKYFRVKRLKSKQSHKLFVFKSKLSSMSVRYRQVESKVIKFVTRI